MKKGIKLIILGIGIFILGAIVVPTAIVLSVVFADTHVEKFLVPGTTRDQIEQPGLYYLWNNYETVFKGTTYNRSESIPDGFKIRIKNTDTCERLDFVSYTSMSSSTGNSSKNTIGYVEVKKPCTLQIEVTGGTEQQVFSFSQSDFLKIMGLFLGGFVVTMVLALTGIGIVVWGIVRLVRANAESKQSDSTDPLA